MNRAELMQKNIFFLLFFLFFVSCSGGKEGRQKIKFDYDWKFSKGDFEKAYEESFDDSKWKTLDIPHDWSITDTFAKSNPSGNTGAHSAGGIGWYRKEFFVDNISEKSKVSIEFGGVYMNSEVWINGHYLGKRPYGYISFNYDLTPYLNWSGKNLLAVRVDNKNQPSSRWYTGSGIYRHVWLVVTDKLHVARHGIYAVPTVKDNNVANVKISTEINNENNDSKSFSLVNEIYSAKGELVASNTIEENLAANDSKKINQILEFDNPTLWSPENPYLYVLKTQVKSGKKIVDIVETKIGIRTIKFTADKGFFLNGKNIKILGTNNHGDLGALGVALNDKVLLRRLKILKEMGSNAVRTGHHPESDEFLNMCDSLGLMVLEDAFDEWLESWPFNGVKPPRGKVKYGYHLYFNEWADRDLTEFIRRDRNHPSIILWGVGNEIPDACFEVGVTRYNKLKETIRKSDTTRLLTSGVTHMHLANASGFASALDVTGYNGGGGSVFMYEKDRETYPERIFLATEVPHSLQTRGVYRTKSWVRDKNPLGGILAVPDYTEEEVFKDVSKFYSSSYDNAMVRISARDSWLKTKNLPYMSGEFRWTGFDYIGEVIMGWPSKSWNYGIIDRCGFPKDTYFFYKSQWTKEPMVHILPHWTWPGKEGVEIPVVAYSNCETVELFLNGKSLGEKVIKDLTDVHWMVPYQPGELLVKGKIGNKEVCSTKVVTASEPDQIKLTTDRFSLTTDKQDVLHIELDILDDKGNFVPTASNMINFNIEGDVTVIGIDNGDPIYQEPFVGTKTPTFNGKCLLVVKSNGNKGKVVITASSPGLKSGQICFEIK